MRHIGFGLASLLSFLGAADARPAHNDPVVYGVSAFPGGTQAGATPLAGAAGTTTVNVVTSIPTDGASVALPPCAPDETVVILEDPAIGSTTGFRMNVYADPAAPADSINHYPNSSPVLVQSTGPSAFVCVAPNTWIGWESTYNSTGYF